MILSDTGHTPTLASRAQRTGEFALILTFWSVIIVLTLAQRALDPRHGQAGQLHASDCWLALTEYGLWALLTPAVFWLSRRFTPEGGFRKWRIVLHAVAAGVAAIGVNAAFHAVLLQVIAFDPPRPFSFLRTITSLRFLDELIIYLAILATGFARDYFLRYRSHLAETAKLRTQAAELHARLAEARLQALRMQINPHFLFNTLHTISNYVERDPRRVRRMIARLSDLLRYSLDTSRRAETALRDELAFLDGYLEIQGIRFEESLTVQKRIEPDVLDSLVPTLILQPLVENAVKHGIATRESGGRIEVVAGREGDRLRITIRDNGPGPAVGGDGTPTRREGIGLRNTRERMESLYGDAQQLLLTEAEGGGFEATLVLPYHTAADLFASAV